jgi:hypothetical protein
MKIEFDTKDLMKGLGKLGDDIRQGVGIAIKKSAFEVEGQAKIFSPVDTGRMWNSIMTFWGGSIFQGGESIMGSVEGNVMTATIIPMVDYAIYVENNDKAYHRRGRAHFMRDSVTEKENDIRGHFNREIERAINNFNK